MFSNKTLLLIALVSMAFSALVSAEADLETYSKVGTIGDIRILMADKDIMMDDALDGNYTDDEMDTMGMDHEHYEGMEHDHSGMDHDMDMDKTMEMDESGAANTLYKIGASIALGALVATFGL